MPLSTPAETETTQRLDRKARKQRAKRLANRKLNGPSIQAGSENPTSQTVAEDEASSPSNFRKPKIKSSDITGLKYFDQLAPLLQRLHKEGCERDTAGNRKLHYDQYCMLILLYLFNPIVTSLRGIQQASELQKVQKKLGCSRASLGSLSEATSVFNPESLQEIIAELGEQLQPMAADSRLKNIDKTITLVDGTLLSVLPQMMEASVRKQETGSGMVKWRLHTHFEIAKGWPVRMDLARNGGGEHDERAMMAKVLEPDRLYVMDRARLRNMMFGASTEKTDNVVGGPEESSDSTDADDESEEPPDRQGDNDSPSDSDKPRPPGHGRRGADDYAGGRQVEVPHPTLAAGDACPSCDQGTLYEKRSGVLVRFVGQAPLQATVYRTQKLRCHVCGEVFTAPAPPGVGDQKYDHTAASMIGLLKYGSGLPFNRIEGLQGNLEIPLAASTQWEIVDAATESLAPAYQELIQQAAQGEVVYNDDTTVKILELMGQRAKENPPDNELGPNRTGMFTSGVVTVREGVNVALFFSGRQHAGENLLDVLRHRATELDAPIQMCDGLSRNLPKELDTIVANCLAHGRRNFVELYDRFPDECRHVIECFKVIYYNDKVAREQEMSAEERLAYHQSLSQRTMDELKSWLQRQFDEKLVEPNSALGDAINYLLKRWDAMTLFLRKAGAPLDNNLCERALKKAILHRKNSMFFKTCNGARVGDMYMSLIHTCELNAENAFDYLNQLQLNAHQVADQPAQWMPWNYRENQFISKVA